MTRNPTDGMEWSGPDDTPGCDNSRCDASGRWRTVLSRREIERIYNTPGERDALPFGWPLPDDVTHACTACGFLYYGNQRSSFDPPAFDLGDPAFEIDSIEWEYDPEETPGSNARALLRQLPSSTTMDDAADLVERYVPGAGRDVAERIIDDLDRAAEGDEFRKYPLEDYM